MAEKKPNRNTLIIGGLLILTIIAFLLIHFLEEAALLLPGMKRQIN